MSGLGFRVPEVAPLVQAARLGGRSQRQGSVQRCRGRVAGDEGRTAQDPRWIQVAARRARPPTFGTLPVNRVQTSQVRAWVKRLADQGVAANTGRNAFRVVKQVFDIAVEDRYIAVVNPCTRMPAKGPSASRAGQRHPGHLPSAGTRTETSGSVPRDVDLSQCLRSSWRFRSPCRPPSRTQARRLLRQPWRPER